MAAQAMHAQRRSGQHHIAWVLAPCERRRRLPSGVFSARSVRPSLLPSEGGADIATCAVQWHAGIAALHWATVGSMERAGEAHALIMGANGRGAGSGVHQGSLTRVRTVSAAARVAGGKALSLLDAPMRYLAVLFGSCARERWQRRQNIKWRHSQRARRAKTRCLGGCTVFRHCRASTHVLNPPGRSLDTLAL